MISFLLFILPTFYQHVASEKKTLIMVNLVYRHGARSPIKFYPNGKYQERDWPDGAGWLTKKGMKIEYNLGLFLRKRYIFDKGFISKLYHHKNVYVRSSGTDRCLQSAETQLAGLFPPQGYQVWNSKISWQPIPVHTIPENNDPLLRSYKGICPRRDSIWKGMKLRPDYKKKVAESADLFDMLTNYTGMKVTADNLWVVADVIKSERTEGLSVPKWADALWERIRSFHEWKVSYNFYDGDELSRLLGGPLLAKMVHNMVALRNNDTRKLSKMNIFSGHDFSLIALSAGLDVKIATPVFGSCIMVELYHSTKTGYVVELFYRNDNTNNPTRLKLKDCNFSCPLDKFIALSRNRISRDRDVECRVI